jgi:hypothetical protein
MRNTVAALLVIVGLPVTVRAQATTDTLSLDGKAAIMAGIGLTGARDATVTTTSARTHTSGEIGSIGFIHWVRPEVAITIGASVLNADETAVGGNVHSNSITPILFGVSYSPRAIALTRTLRPYLSAAAGPYFHVVQSVGPASATTTTETAAGARLAGGVDWFAARHFMMSLEGDYHAVGHFDRLDAASSDPSGFGLSLAFGVSWGGR